MNPINKLPLFTILFLVLVVTGALALLLFPQIRIAVETMTMITIFGYYLINAKKKESVFILGMVVAIIGELFLIGLKEYYIAIGTLMFVLMKLCYSYTFLRERRRLKKTDLPIIAFFSLFTLPFLYSLWDSIDTILKVSFIITALSYGIFFNSAFLRNKKLVSYKYILIGCFLIVSSDLTYAFFTFSNNISSLQNIAAIFLFTIGQFLIVSGKLLDKYRPSK